jgi:chemotaxis protein MotB
MAGQTNAAPVIIKRKKVVGGGGHHGGAWKVAYADFVTAMMAFFLLMWLLNATTEKQRKGLSDYFSPTIPVNRISGGGDGAFGGDSMFSEDVMAQSGTGANDQKPTEQVKARGPSGEDDQKEDNPDFARMEKELFARGGESNTMEKLLRHVVTRVTDEGLVIELFDIEGTPLFLGETSEPTPRLTEIIAVVAEVLALASNSVAVQGHLRAYPVMMRDNPVWDLSAARAMALRQMLQDAGHDPERLQRVTGFADRKPITRDPRALRNNRVEIVLLRKNR